MTTVLTIAVPVVALIAVLAGLRWLLLNRSSPITRLARSRFKREDMVLASKASLQGIRSTPVDGLRGEGALVLTRDLLWFVRAKSSLEISIPVASIRAVHTPMSFMDRPSFRELLSVRWEGDQGDNEAAWSVDNPHRWRQALELIRASR